MTHNVYPKRMTMVTLALSCLSATVAMILINGVAKAEALFLRVDSDAISLIVGLVAFLLVGYIVGIHVSKHRHFSSESVISAAIIAAYCGIAFGVIICIFVEELIFKHLGNYPIYMEHNLFPLEIVMWCVLGSISGSVGLVIGRWTYRHHHSKIV